MLQTCPYLCGRHKVILEAEERYRKKLEKSSVSNKRHAAYESNYFIGLFFTNCPYSIKLRFEFQTCLAWFRSSYSCKLTCFIWYTTNLYWMRLEQVNSVLRSWWTWILYLKQWWIFVANNTVLFARVSQNISRREYTKLK